MRPSLGGSPFYSRFSGSVDAGEWHLGSDKAEVGVDAGEGGLVDELLRGEVASGRGEVVGAEEGEKD